MKRFVATARGRVQRVGYREHVFNETFGKEISGYVKNLDTGEVEIVAEGNESELQDLIKEINIIQRPIAVQSFTIRWEEPTGAFSSFEIIRGDIQEETFERMDYAGNVLHKIERTMDESLKLQYMTLNKQDQTLEKQDQMLNKQDQTLEKQDQMLNKQDQMIEISTESLQNGKEIQNEVQEFRKDAKSYLGDEFREIRKKLTSIEDALARAGIQV